MARFLHMADLHLGRSLHQVRLLEDQRYALEGILTLVANMAPKVDAVFLAGDVYDRALPPAEAVALLTWFIGELVNTHGIQVVMIPGNHDSAERMGFLAELTKSLVHIAPPLQADIEPLSLRDDHGTIDVFALPFLDPSQVRAVTGNPDVHDQQTAMAAMVKRMNEASHASRKILIAHAFVNAGMVASETSESERELFVGGSSVVDSTTFSDFNYVALGHLHRPQKVGDKRVQYSGSLLKYSKSEADHQKSVTIVDMHSDGSVDVRREVYPIKHDLRVVTGLFDELLGPGIPASDDYLFFELQDRDPKSEAMTRLRVKYPNSLHLRYAQHHVETALETAAIEHQEVSLQSHFASFYEQVTGVSLEPDQQETLQGVIAELEDLGDEL